MRQGAQSSMVWPVKSSSPHSPIFTPGPLSQVSLPPTSTYEGISSFLYSARGYQSHSAFSATEALSQAAASRGVSLSRLPPFAPLLIEASFHSSPSLSRRNRLDKHGQPRQLLSRDRCLRHVGAGDQP